MAGKIITIDWPTIAALPSDEYHIKLLNKQQAAVLQALCEYQHWLTRWDNLELTQDELDRFMGDIEFRLMGDETGGFMTVEELIEGVCGGLVCAAPKIGAMLATGVTSGFSVDDAGNPTIGGGGEDTVELPDDDPATEIDETAAARAGGMFSIAKGINAIIALTNTYFGADATADMTPAEAVTLIGLQYKIDETLMLGALTDMWAIKAASLGVIASLTEATVAGSLYCKGLSYQSINRVVLATAGISTASKVATADIVNAVTMEQIGDWYESGTLLPTTTYKEFTCVPSPTEVINYATLGVAVNSQTAWKNNHRLLFTVENYFTDSLGNVVDFWWYDAVGVTAPVNRISSVNMQLGTGITKPTINQVPFAAGHKYQFTIDTPAAAGSLQLTIPSTGMTAPITPSVAGVGIKVTIEDLGEILV